MEKSTYSVGDSKNKHIFATKHNQIILCQQLSNLICELARHANTRKPLCVDHIPTNIGKVIISSERPT